MSIEFLKRINRINLGAYVVAPRSLCDAYVNSGPLLAKLLGHFDEKKSLIQQIDCEVEVTAIHAYKSPSPNQFVLVPRDAVERFGLCVGDYLEICVHSAKRPEGIKPVFETRRFREYDFDPPPQTA